MTSSAINRPSLFHDLLPLYTRLEPFINKGNELAERIYTHIFPYFKVGSAVFFCSSGCLESLRVKSIKDKSLPSSLFRQRHPSNEYLSIHSGLLVSTGLCHGMEALQGFAYLQLGQAFPLVSAAGNMFILLANLLALEENIHCYEGLQAEKTEKDEQLIFLAKQSAIWGMLSNLGYIVTSSVSLLGAGTALTLVMGLIAAFSGFLKVLFDFFSLMHEKRLSVQ